MTAVPVLALSGWKGLVTFDTGVGAGFFATIRSACKTSGILFKLSRLWGLKLVQLLLRLTQHGQIL